MQQSAAPHTQMDVYSCRTHLRCLYFGWVDKHFNSQFSAYFNRFCHCCLPLYWFCIFYEPQSTGDVSSVFCFQHFFFSYFLHFHTVNKINSVWLCWSSWIYTFSNVRSDSLSSWNRIINEFVNIHTLTHATHPISSNFLRVNSSLDGESYAEDVLILFYVRVTTNRRNAPNVNLHIKTYFPHSYSEVIRSGKRNIIIFSFILNRFFSRLKFFNTK